MKEDQDVVIRVIGIRYELNDENMRIELWARNDGKANTENKYDFPPPVDTKLYFGTCCLVSINPVDGKYLDLEKL